MEEGGAGGIRRRIVTVVSESCRLLTAAARKTAISSSYPYRSDNFPGLKRLFEVCKVILSPFGLDATLRPQTASEGVSLWRYLPAPVSSSTPAPLITGHADESVAPGLNPAALLILLRNDLLTNKPPNHFPACRRGLFSSGINSNRLFL